jgi:F420-0:gamma-glutamyl ligase-like protein
VFQINVVALVLDTHITCEILNSYLGAIQAANPSLQVFSVNILVVLLEYAGPSSRAI